MLLLLALLAVLPASSSANTVLGTQGCATAAALSITSPNGGGSAGTTADCSIEFGSSDGTAMLHVSQTDGGGSALARPAAGTLDTTFAGDGHLEDDHSTVDDEYRGVAIQPDGRIVVLGTDQTTKDMYVRRYLPSGGLDPSFGSGGEAFLSNTWDARDIALAPDGSMIVLGYGGNRVQVAKLTPSGTLDPRFGVGGINGKYYQGADAAHAGIAAESVIVGRGGVVYFAGTTALTNGAASDITVGKLTAAGQYDTTFDGDGIEVIDLGGNDDGRGIVEQADGKVVVVGRAGNATTDMAILRLTATGVLDPGFGTGGIVEFDSGGGSDVARYVAQRPTGELVVGGRASYATADVTVLQLRPDGSFDPAFGTGGVARLATAASEEVYDGALQPDGSLVLAGKLNGADEALLLARMTSSGFADTSFGTGGFQSYDDPVTGEELHGVAAGLDGRIAAVGMSTSLADDSADLLVSAPIGIADYRSGSKDFTTGTNAFGACLSSVANGAATDATTWQASAGCSLVNGAWWNAVPTRMGAASKVATTTSVGNVSALAKLRFGVHLAGSEPPGSYVAPLSIDVISPNLDAPVNTAPPTVSGSATLGSVLTTTNGSWSGSATITYAQQWQRCNPTCVDIAGATGASYRIGSGDAGASLRARVTATNSLDSVSASSAQTGVVASTSGIFHVTGFEHGTADPAGGGVLTSLTGAGSAARSAVARTGASGMRFVTASQAKQWNVSLPTANTYLDASARTYFNLASFPASTITIAEFEAAGPTYCEVQVSSSGQLQAKIGGGAIQTGPTIALNGWHRLDFGCDFRAGTWTASWSIDGAALTPATLTSQPARFVNIFQIGVDISSTMSITYDDLAISSSVADYPIGAGHVIALTPNGTGTHVTPGSFTYSTTNGTAPTTIAAGDSNSSPGTAQYIDDWPGLPSYPGTPDLIAQTTSAGQLNYTLSDTTETGQVNAVRVLAAARDSANATGDNLTLDLDSGAGPQVALSLDPANVVSYYGATLRTQPNSTSAWTQASLNSLQFALRSTSTTPNPWTDAVIVEVDVADSPPPVNTAVPVVTGAPAVGQTLAASTGSWTPGTGLAFTYQWQRCSPGCVDIPGATSATYPLVAADRTNTVRVVVTATKDGQAATATSATTSAVAAGAPTLTHIDGFEGGIFDANGSPNATYSAVVTTGGTITTDDDFARNGNRSVRLAQPGNASDLDLEYTMSGTRGVVRFAFRAAQLPTTGTRELAEVLSPDGVGCSVEYDAPTGKLFGDIASARVLGPVIQTGRWYVIDMTCDSSTGTRRLDWMVDGTPVLPQVTFAQATNTLTKFTIGSTVDTTGAYVVDYDDVATSVTTADYPIGFGAIDALSVNQTGIHSTPGNFGASTDGGASFNPMVAEDDVFPGTAALLAERPASFNPGVSGGILRQVATTGYAEYYLADDDRPEAPYAVKGVGTHSAPTAATVQNAQLLANLSGTTTTLYAGDPGGTANSLHVFEGLMTTRPGGGAWTAANLATLRLRLGSTNVGTVTGERPWTHDLFVEAAFPAIPHPVNLAAPQVQLPGSVIANGSVLSAVPGTWNIEAHDSDWRWVRCDTTGEGCNVVPNERGTTYTVGPADVGWTIRAVEEVRNTGGTQTARSNTVTVPLPAAPTLLGPSTSATNAGLSTITITRPAATVAGTLLVAGIATQNDKTATLAGWTSLGHSTNSVGLDILYRVAGSSEPASYVFSLGTAANATGGIIALGGVSSSPIDVTGLAASSWTAPSVTTQVGNTVLIGCWANTAAASTPPAGMTEQWDLASGGAVAGVCSTQTLGVTPGATGTRTATSAGANPTSRLVAIRP